MAKKSVADGQEWGQLTPSEAVEREAVDAKARGHQAMNEAPMLRRLVADGLLTPLANRLPTVPLVVAPRVCVGTYGGTWRSAILGASDTQWIKDCIGFDSLMTVDLREDGQVTAPYPSIASAVHVSPNGKEFFFELREGLRWSDGVPVGADDIIFAVRDVLLNKSLNPRPNEVLTAGGSVATVTKLNERKVRFAFRVPAPFFLAKLATAKADLILPMHYLKNFHMQHNPAANDVAVALGRSDWRAAFMVKNDRFANEELPTLAPWRIVRRPSSADRIIAERNPYYWKVDTAGNQLPYLDRVEFEILHSTDDVLRRVTEGKIDLHQRHINTLRNREILLAKAERGCYGLYTVLNGRNTEFALQLNMTHEHPALGHAFRQKDVRIGLSHAINRREIIDAVFEGQGIACQVAQSTTSLYYHEILAEQYTEFNLERANHALDRAGCVKRDNEGYRRLDDGSRFAIEILLPIGLSDAWLPALELICQHWRHVGVSARVVPLERSLWAARIEMSAFDATVWVGTECTDEAIYRPAYYLPYKPTVDGAWSAYAIRWNEWYTSGGIEGERPPDLVREQFRLYDKVQTTVNETERRQAFGRILDIAAEQFYVIGILRPTDGFGIVSKRLRNAPLITTSSGFNPNGPGPGRPEQFYLAE